MTPTSYYGGSKCKWTGLYNGYISYSGSDSTGDKLDQASIHFAQENVHDFFDWIIVKDATCKESGSKERTCWICREKETEIIPKLEGHSFSDFWDVVKYATCKEPGLQERVCYICGEKQTEVIPKLSEHLFDYWKTEKVSTCKEAGIEERTCTICGVKETREIPMLSYHSYGDWTIVQEPAVNLEGKRERTCEICGDKQSEIIPSLPKQEIKTEPSSLETLLSIEGETEPLSMETPPSTETETEILTMETAPSAETETEILLIETPPSAEAKKETTILLKIGAVLSDKRSSSKYKVLKDKKTVEYKAPLKKTVSKVTIPATVKISGKTFKVKSIAANAFKGCKKLTTVTIGKNITTIGKKAFYNCNKLKKVVVKTSILKKVGANAFKGIHANATIKVPKKKVKAYTKLLKKKGIGKKVKITK